MPTVEPMPTLPVEMPWWLIEWVDWDFTTSEALVNPTGIKGNDPANDLGGASLTLQSANAQVQRFVDGHQVVRYSVLDLAASALAEAAVYRPLYAAVMDRPKVTVIAEGEDADEQAVMSGRSVLAQWAFAEVDPPGGPGVEPVTPDRVWNFSHSAVNPYAGPWTDATYRSTQGATTTSPPEGLNGAPWNFANPLAFWLAPTPTPGTNDYNGIYLLAFDYELDADSQVIFDATACNAFMLWVNERLVGSVWDYPDGDASTDSWRASAHFPAGTLRVRVAVGNFPNVNTAGTTTANPGLFVLSASRPSVRLDGRYDEEWLFTTADGWDSSPGAPGRWRALDYTVVNNEPPGPRVGQVVVDLLGEAQARDQLLAWSVNFTATHDTNGTLWPVINGLTGFSVPIGTTYLDVLAALRDAGYIEYDVTLDGAGRPVLHAWTPGTAGSVKTDGLARGNDAGTGNIQSLEYDVDHTGARDQLLVSYEGGTMRVGSGPKSGFLAVNATTAEEAERLALEQLARAEPVLSVSASHTWIDQEAGPYWGWGKYDTIPAVASTGLPAPARVMAIAFEADSDTGRPLYTPTLNALPKRPERRVADTAINLAAGNLGGRTAAAIPATQRQRPMERLDLIQIQWSLPGDAADLASGLAPPERLMRLNRILVTSKSGSANTYIALTHLGSLVADTTIGAGTPVEVWRSYLASVLYPDGRVQLLVGAGGALADHQDLVIVGYGAPMGVPALASTIRR